METTPAARRGDEAVPPPPGSEWHPLEAFGVIALTLVLAGLLYVPVAALVGGKSQALVGGIVAELALGGSTVLWLTLVRRGAFRSVMLRPNGTDLGVGAGAGAVVWLVGTLVVAAVITIFVHAVSGVRVTQPHQLPGGLDAGQLVVAGVFVVVAAFCEELFFRGFLFRSLRARFGFVVSALISAVFFGAAHLDTPGGLSGSVVLGATMVFVGFAFAAVYEWRRNLIADIASHATFNLISIILLALTAAH